MSIRDKILGWQWFRDFFNITIFKYFVTWFAIVPIFAKVTEDLPKKIEIPTGFYSTYIVTLDLPFKWEILWFSSLCFVISYILYIIFCPKFINKYFSLKYYKEFEHSPRWLVWEAEKLIHSDTDLEKFVKRMIEKKYIEVVIPIEDFKKTNVIVEEKQTNLMFKYKEIVYSFKMPILNNEGMEDTNLTNIAVREIFWEIFGRFSSSNICVRGIIYFLLIVSLVCFAIPFGQSIINGFHYFAK